MLDTEDRNFVPQQSTVTAREMAILAEAKRMHLHLARIDPAAFCSYVLRDEETNAPITLRDMHREWHDLVSAHQRVLFWGHVESGKTTMLSVGRTLFELGRNPNLRCVVVSQSDAQAKKITALLSKYIKYSKELREVFPHLVPDENAAWNQHEMFVKRETKAKDPSILSIGERLGKIQGARIDWLVLDDILGYTNTKGPTARDDTWAWLNSELLKRVTERGKIVCVGNAWHLEDSMHRLAAMKGNFKCMRYPLINSQGESNWPERWSSSRIEEVRRTSLPLEFARMFMCKAIADDSYWFSRSWVDQCIARGASSKMLNSLQAVPAGWSTFTGVDLSTGKKGSDLSVLFTIAVSGNGDRRVLMIESGRWTAPEILDRIRDTHSRYFSTFIVEDNAAQSYIGQMLTKQSAIPVRPYTTTAKTHSRDPGYGMGRVATEFRNAKWIIPSFGGQVPREVQEWITEMMQYDGQSHPGDRLMASLFASEGPNYKKPTGRVVRFDVNRR